jgi:hypothetical protein
MLIHVEIISSTLKMEAVFSSKHQETSTRLYGATSQETVFFIVTCVRNSNSTEFEHCLEVAHLSLYDNMVVQERKQRHILN